VAAGGFKTKNEALIAGAMAWVPDAYRGKQEANWLNVELSDGTYGYSYPNIGSPGNPIVRFPSLTAIIGKSFGDAVVTNVFAIGHNHLWGDLVFSGADGNSWRDNKALRNIPLYLWNEQGDASKLTHAMVTGTPLQTYSGQMIPALDIDPIWSGP
jgi:hypothetical protein